MKIVLEILRRTSSKDTPYWQRIPFETTDEGETVATALRKINGAGTYLDAEGQPVSEIRWESSCLQKKCGACAMVIAGRPRLACDTFLREFRKKGRVTVEPLRKFPVVADLLVDRSILYANLREMHTWMPEAAVKRDSNPSKKRGKPAREEQNRDDAFEASKCLQCGCCLEICPNFCPGDPFFGAASFVPTSRLLLELPPEELKELKEAYRAHAYAGCGKSLSCKEICPAGIDTDHLLSRSNAIAVWGRKA